MEHVLIVKLDDDMSPGAVEELKHAISAWRGVRGVEWHEAAQQSVQPTNGGLCVHCGVPEWRHKSVVSHLFKSPTPSG